MRRYASYRAASFVCVSLIATACATGNQPSAAERPLADARQTLVAAMRDCGTRFDYDPDKLTGVGEHSLAPQELQWRQCAYDAARAYASKNPQLASMYERLIRTDVEMTTAVQNGVMTRTTRRNRNEQQLTLIRQAEEQQIRESAAAHDRQTQQVHQVVDGLRGFR